MKFKFGTSLEGKEVQNDDLVAINAGMDEGGESGIEVTEQSDFGAIYKGSKILGTTRADQLKTTRDITIAGGPLAAELKSVYPDGIPAGTTMQDLFMALACQEQWPNPEATYSYGTLTTTLSAPTVTTPSWHNTLAEYGATVSTNAVSAKNATHNDPYLTFDNFAYGYENSEGSYEAESEENNPTRIKATVATADVTYTMTKTYSGFGKASSDNESTANVDATKLAYSAEDLTVALGANTVVYKLSVDKEIHSATVSAPEVYYAKSNLGNTNNKAGNPVQKVDATTTKTLNAGKPGEKSTTTFKVTGVYPVYHNQKDGALGADVNVRFALADTKEFEYDFVGESDHRVSFAYPATKTVKVYTWNDMAKSWDEYTGDKTNAAEASKRNINGNEIQYNVWSHTAENAWSGGMKVKFELSNKTSVA